MPSKQLYACDACFGKLENYKSWTTNLAKDGWLVVKTKDGNTRYICPDCSEFTKGVLYMADIPYIIDGVTDGSAPELLTICGA